MSRDPDLSNALVEALRGGGCVLIMRHASVCFCTSVQGLGAPKSPAGELQLDECGKGAARVMGDVIQRLQIGIQEVYSSPQDRACETARLVGGCEPKQQIQLDDNESATPAQAAWLRARVKQPLARGTNILIVTHMSLIVGSFADIVSCVAPGEALVFSCHNSARGVPLERVRIEDWPALLDFRRELLGKPA